MRKRVQLYLFGASEPLRAAPVTARIPRRSRSKALSPAPLPWDAVVLGVDTARQSGWAVSVQGKRVDSGEVDTLDSAELDRVVQWAVRLAEVGKLPLVLVLEAPYGGSVHVVAALGVARERWQRAWRDAGQSQRRVVRVMPSVWRAAVLGRHSIGMPRDEVRLLEQGVASVLFKRELGPDEAPACLIAHWGAQAGAVGRAIGVRGRRASLRRWQESDC